MRSTTERVRAELAAQTGVDFARYRDDSVVDAVTGWTALMGVAVDAMIAAGIGVAVAAAHVIGAAAGTVGQVASVGLVVSGFVSGVGITVVTFAYRLRRRIPTEADKVFVVTGAMAERVAADIGSGALTVTPGQAARGVALVAAIPAMTRIAQRRFPLIGTLAAPVAGAVLTKTLARAWPATSGGVAMSGLEGKAHQLESAVDSARRAVIPKLAGAIRWATLPLVVFGGVLMALSLLVTALAVALG
ncbi:hypothetical protein BH23ACT5_BH23ACT5_09610 [soil metagenome]